MKKSMKCIALVLVLAVSLAMCVSCSSSSSSSSSSNTKIKAKIILVLKDKTEVPYNITVKKGSTLRKALYQAKLIDKKTYGAMFIEDIDGHVANVEKDGCTWNPTDKNHKQISGTFDEIKVKDGETIYLEYYKVPDAD